MDQKHRDLINKNMTTLIEETNLDILLPVLLEREVFSQKMIEPLMEPSKTVRNRKCSLYLDIQRRGPNAFDLLVKSLQETGHWNLVKLLSPESALNTQFISIKEAKQSHKASTVNVPGISQPVEFKPLPSNHDPLSEMEFVKINVVKSTKFGESPNSEILCYSMKSRKRGVFFMINNVQFKDDVEEYREGALKDQENLKELFHQIGFHQIIIHNDKSKKEMEDLLEDFASSDILDKTDCVFIVIASHGMSRGYNETNIIASDGGILPSDDILELFNNKNCQQLQHIPKIFIFQVCRGESPDFGVRSEVKPKHRRTQLDGKVNNASMRTYSDMLVAHSTVPGFSSHRDTVLGSWYMLCLCKVFMEHAHASHLEDLFKLVDSHLKDINLQRSSVQTSSIENRGFNKFCFLNPGFFG